MFPRLKINELDLLAIKTIAGTGVFVLTSIVCIWLLATNAPISEGVTVFASTFFALILAVLGVNGWQAIQKRKTEWEPSQPVKDQIQMARMLQPPSAVVKPFVPVGDPNEGDSENAPPEGAEAGTPVTPVAPPSVSKVTVLAPDIDGEGD